MSALLSRLKLFGIGAGVIALTVLGALAAVFRAREQEAEAKASEQQERADQADASANTLGAINTGLTKLRAKQQQERQAAAARRAKGKRDDLDNTWGPKE